MSPEAPPLMEELTALPLLLPPIEAPPDDDPSREAGAVAQVEYARLFVYRSGVDPAAIALAARLPVMGLGALLVLSVFLWGRRFHGEGPALLATAVAAFAPDLLANSELATTGLGCAALRFFAARRPRRLRHPHLPLPAAPRGAGPRGVAPPPTGRRAIRG